MNRRILPNAARVHKILLDKYIDNNKLRYQKMRISLYRIHIQTTCYYFEIMDLFLNIDMQINNKFLRIGSPSIYLQEKSCEFVASFITAKGTRKGINFRLK